VGTDRHSALAEVTDLPEEVEREIDEIVGGFVDRLRARQQDRGLAEAERLFNEIAARSASGPQADDDKPVPPRADDDDRTDAKPPA
jgi:hypothetical protein